MQTIALFGLKLHRFPGLVGAVTFFVVYDPLSPWLDWGETH
jgi:hypothetical protein